jgi:hypothetical protein
MSALAFPENLAATVSVPLPLKDGAPWVPTSATFDVRDEAGVVILPTQPIDLDGVTDAVFVTVSGSVNNLAGRVRGARTVTVVLTYPDGTLTKTTSYLVQATLRLKRLTNSFVSEGEALMIRAEMPSLEGWDAASEDERLAALVTAHKSLCRLTLRYKRQTSMSRVTWGEDEGSGYTYVYELDRLLDSEWDEIDPLVKTALQRAQMREADTLLRGDPVADRRRAGIISETVGESSMFFRQVPEVRGAVSREAMEEIGRYVVRSTRIARG